MTTATILLKRRDDGVVWTVLKGASPGDSLVGAFAERLRLEVEDLMQHHGRREHVFTFDVRAR